MRIKSENARKTADTKSFVLLRFIPEIADKNGLIALRMKKAHRRKQICGENQGERVPDKEGDRIAEMKGVWYYCLRKIRICRGKVRLLL